MARLQRTAPEVERDMIVYIAQREASGTPYVLGWGILTGKKSPETKALGRMVIDGRLRRVETAPGEYRYDVTEAGKAWMNIIENVRQAARENARQSTSFDRLTGEYGPEIQANYTASVRSIGDSLQSEREYNSYAHTALSPREAGAIVQMLIREGY